MGVLAEAVVQIVAHKQGLDTTLGAAKGDLTKFTGFASSSFSKIGVLAGGALAAAGLGGGIGAVLLGATKKAADLNEQLSKTKAVFGASTSIVTGTVDELAGKFGVIKTQAFEAASNIGLITKGAGLTEEASAKLAGTFTRLAADASSFYNVPIDVALEKIRSGLVGESEPIRSFGVLLSEAAVQTEAVAIGASKAGEKLSESAKVQARASLIVKGLATATGDLERTQDSLSNKQRKLTGDMENFATTLGQKLVDPMSKLIDLANELGTSFGKAFGTTPVDAFATSLGSAVDALRVVNIQGNKNGVMGVVGNIFAAQTVSALNMTGLGDTGLARALRSRLEKDAVDALKGGTTDVVIPNPLSAGERRFMGQRPKAIPGGITSPADLFPGLFVPRGGIPPTPEAKALQEEFQGLAVQAQRARQGLLAAFSGQGPDVGYAEKREAYTPEEFKLRADRIIADMFGGRAKLTPEETGTVKNLVGDRLIGERKMLSPAESQERIEASRSLIGAITGGLSNLPQIGDQAGQLFDTMRGVYGRGEPERFGSAQTFSDALSYSQSTQQAILDQSSLASEQLDATKEIPITFREVGKGIMDRLELLAKPTAIRHMNAGGAVISGPE